MKMVKVVGFMMSVFMSVTNTNAQPLGSQNDDHGCVTDGGYQWCENLNRCVRPWLTPCPSTGNVPVVDPMPMPVVDPFANNSVPETPPPIPSKSENALHKILFWYNMFKLQVLDHRRNKHQPHRILPTEHTPLPRRTPRPLYLVITKRELGEVGRHRPLQIKSTPSYSLLFLRSNRESSSRGSSFATARSSN